MHAHTRGQHPTAGLDDLREGLPEPFRHVSDADIARTWLAWDAARRGHQRQYLIATIGVTGDVADQLITLAADLRAPHSPPATSTSG